MRRRPKSKHLPRRVPALDLRGPNFPAPPTLPTSMGDALEPFIVGGGFPYYPTGYAGGLLPETDGVQLLAHQYVPRGRIGFIKHIMVAPCAPPILVDPWRGWDAFFNSFEAGSDPFNQTQRAPAQGGLWETPLAWEGYFNPGAEMVIPSWRWSITLVQGDVDLIRNQQGLNPFSILSPPTWYLAPSTPVPASTYRGGLPGAVPNGSLSEQRIQHTPSSPLAVHILCPENTTICLWAKWRQDRLQPVLAYGPNGALAPWEGAPVAPAPPPLPDIYPLLPSVGQLAGYLQAADRPPSVQNALYGWGA
jgi:hypothetical protein